MKESYQTPKNHKYFFPSEITAERRTTADLIIMLFCSYSPLLLLLPTECPLSYPSLLKLSLAPPVPIPQPGKLSL